MQQRDRNKVYFVIICKKIVIVYIFIYICVCIHVCLYRERLFMHMCIYQLFTTYLLLSIYLWENVCVYGFIFTIYDCIQEYKSEQISERKPMTKEFYIINFNNNNVLN